MKRISVIVSSILIFHTPVQPINALGAAIAILGTFLYSQASGFAGKHEAEGVERLPFLGCLDQFPHPKVELEQYPTGPYTASRLLFTVENSFGDVSDKVVADFGCGCGTLGIAAGLLSAEHVLSIDIDPESLEIASLNAEELELDMDFIQSNVLDLRWRSSTIDTIIMNPPFGTWKKGADLDFLSAAFKVASQAVYSLHKTTTRDHVKCAAMRDFNARGAEVLCELRFDVPKLYKFHKKKEVDIAVDLWRFVPAKHQSRGI